MSINNLCLSQDGRFIQVWNNGNRIRTIYIRGDMHEAVAEGRLYLKQWADDDNPNIDKDLGKKLKDIDSLICKLAFAGEWK